MAYKLDKKGTKEERKESTPQRNIYTKFMKFLAWKWEIESKEDVSKES